MPLPGMVLKVCCTLLALSVLAGAASGGDVTQTMTETFLRRACKFKPLPTDLSEGHMLADGTAQVADVFGLPELTLVQGSHNITATLEVPSVLGLSLQLPFATGASVSVLLLDNGGTPRRCSRTWGAGGRLKQCSFAKEPLQAGRLQLSFEAQEAGSTLAAAPSSGAGCLPVRLDLEIRPGAPESLARASPCPPTASVPPPLLEGLAGGVADVRGTWTAAARDGVVWSSRLPGKASEGTYFGLVSARLLFPTWVRPMQLLLEEVSSRTDPTSKPACRLRCVGGTPIPSGQVLQHLLPLGMLYTLWILAQDDEGCFTFDFEAQVRQAATEQAPASSHFLGPPAWLCEGASFPARLEQVLMGPEVSQDRPVLRAKRFSLHDVLDLTRPVHGVDHGHGGLRTIELQVAVLSLLRVTTQSATVPGRPVLVPGSPETAWWHLGGPYALPTSEIVLAGGEARYVIHGELSPGQYTILFDTDLHVGGLRPCASVLVHLALEPRAGAEPDGLTEAACKGGDLSSAELQSYITARSSNYETDELSSDPEAFQLTLPKPSLATATPGETAAAVLATAQFRLPSVRGVEQVFVWAKVVSSFVLADVGVRLLQGGAPLGEAEPSPDGRGYAVFLGPLQQSDEEFEVELSHIPASHLTGGSFCVPLSVDFSVAAVRRPVGPALLGATLPLPGSQLCDMSAPTLPTEVWLPAGWPLIVEGDFLLPTSGVHSIAVASSGSETVVVRAIVSSSDAEVRVVLEDEPTDTLLGLSKDQALLIHNGQEPSHITIIVARLPTTSICPTMHVHLVALRSQDIPKCPGSNAHQKLLGDNLRAGLRPQQVDRAELSTFALPLAAEDASVDFRVDAATAELRFELGIHPPWLPLEVVITSAASADKVWARARPAAQRLALLVPSLPRGDYALRLRVAGEMRMAVRDHATALPIEDSFIRSRCALAIGAVALLIPSGRDTSNFRQEMLNLPELIAVMPLPRSLTPSWLAEDATFVSSQMYAVPNGGEVTSVQVRSPSLLRLVVEPADLLAPRLTVEVKKGSNEVVLYTTELSSSVVVRLSEAGSYELRFSPVGGDSGGGGCIDCPHQSVPFMFTVGLAGLRSIDTGVAACPGEGLVVPRFAPTYPGLQRNQHGWRSVRHLRAAPGSFLSPIRVPLPVPRPSVVLLGAWSPFVDHYVRVSLKTEEGLWVGEQRMRQSLLEIELPPGTYEVQVEAPKPPQPLPRGCLTFGMVLSQSFFMPPSSFVGSRRAAAGLMVGRSWSSSLGAKCSAIGASPLPLDVFSRTGGSQGFGGPVGDDGRLLVRRRVLLTNIHDGRKKVFLRATSTSALRISVVSGDAARVEAVLEDATHRALAPEAVWSHGGMGWSAVYRVTAASGMWLSFHLEHEDAHVSGCAAFELLLQMAPLGVSPAAGDVHRMSQCDRGGPEGSPISLSELLAKAERAGEAAGFVARADAPQGTSAELGLTVDSPSVVEVEVQFNLLLSNVDLWLQDAAVPAHAARAGPELGGTGPAQSPLNAHAVLQLHLRPGRHTVRISHEGVAGKLGSKGAAPGQCFPLRVVVRLTAWRAAVINAALASPVPPGADVVAAVVSPLGAGALRRMTVAGIRPSAAAEHGGSIVATWDAGHLLSTGRLIRGQHVVEDPSSTQLPIQVDGRRAGYVWLLKEGWKSTPWSGEDRHLVSELSRPWVPRPAAGEGEGPEVAAEHLHGAGPLGFHAKADPRKAILWPPAAHAHDGKANDSSTGPGMLAWLIFIAIVVGGIRSMQLSGAGRWIRGWLLRKLTDVGSAGPGGSGVGRELSSVVEITRVGAGRDLDGYGSTARRT